MNYQVLFAPNAKKDLRKIPKEDCERILISVAALAQDPFAGKKLSGKYEGSYSLRIWPYRVIYRVFKKELVVMVIQVGQRGGVYK